MQANVRESFDLPNVAAQLLNLQNETMSACREAQSQAESCLEETHIEEQNSLQMLNSAKEVEEVAQAALTIAEGAMAAAEANLAAALAEEALAVASMNPAAIAAASARVVSAQETFSQAQQAYETAKNIYEMAKAHRELLEKRYEMARQCVNLAEMMKTKLDMNCMSCLSKVAPTVEKGTSRIYKAYEDLQKYHSENTSVSDLQTPTFAKKSVTFQSQNLNSASKISNTTEKFSAKNNSETSTEKTPAAKKSSANLLAYKNWANYSPEVGKPANTKEIHDRFNVSSEIMQGLLENLYNTDENFRRQVDSYREQAKVDRQNTETKIKKNMAGRLGEEIVTGTLKPYGEIAETQVKHELDGGGYTKTDFVLKNLKVPLILGRGEGLGVREGGSVAIEIKTGQENYLQSQLGHIQTQTHGHQEYDASFVIFSRDIKNIGAEKQQNYRQAIHETGSPPIGYLPYKSEIDKACLDFVFKEQI